jgi:hypothetical protein
MDTWALPPVHNDVIAFVDLGDPGPRLENDAATLVSKEMR